MANMTKDTTNNIWPYNITINSSGSIQHTFATQNKFIDANIVATITTPARGTLSLDLDDNTNTILTVGTLANNKYPFTANLGGTVTAASAGWITNSAESVSENNVTVGYLNKAGFTISANGNEFVCNSPGYVESGNTVLGSITAVTPTASIDTGTSNNYNGLTTYFTKLTNSTGANVTIKPQYSTSAGYVSSASNSITTANITYWSIKTASPTFSAAPTGGSTATFNNITTSDTDNGIQIQTKYSINSATISYAAAATGWIDKAANASTGSSTTSKSSTNGTVYYITGITVPTGKNFSLTTTANNNTDTSKVTITNNNNRNIEITNAGTVYSRQTTSGKGNVYVKPYGGSTDIQIVSNGTMLTSTVTTPTWTKNGTSKVATMGDFTYTDGYISSGTLDAATFHNTATSGTTYVDLSDALVSAGGSYVVPEIGSDGFLYIDRGYIDNIKISLGHLIPGTEGSSALVSGVILSGYSAYDKDGNLITGSITTQTASGLTFDTSTGTFTAAAGYYASNTDKVIGVGIVTPNYNFPGSNDTDLDNYITTSGASSSSYDVSINKTYTNTAGYIGAHTNTSSGTTYYKLKAPTFESAGGSSSLTADTTNTSSARSIYTAATDTFISIGSSAPALNTTGQVYIKVSSSDQVKTTSSGRGAIKSSVTVSTAGTHTSYIGIDLYNGEYSTAAVTT